MRWLEQHLDLIMAAVIVVLLILRDNGVLVLSAETLLYLGVGGASARGIWEMRKRGSIEKGSKTPESGRFEPPASGDDTTPKDGAA